MNDGAEPHLDAASFYKAAIKAIQTARNRGVLELRLAKLHGVAERRPEPKPMAGYVTEFKCEVERCISDGWDVRIIERVEDRAHLNGLLNYIGQFALARGYLVKASHGNEGLPFLNVLIAGDEALLALDDPQYRLALMGLALSGPRQTTVIRKYWDELWERCPYWVRRASGPVDGVGGIASIEEQLGPSSNNPAFVAMWFGDVERAETPNFMTRLYKDGLESGVTSAGYKAIRVDFVDHAEFIMNKVFSLIRVAPFVVADLTGNRNGVYYEAGFARALGQKPVIHTCRRSHFDDAHFDVRQINTIVWETPEELAIALRNRIIGISGLGPFTGQPTWLSADTDR